MTNQSYVYGWLYRRIEWERTLADLHVRAQLAAGAGTVLADDANPASDETPAPAAPPRRPRARTWSPIRGMSVRRAARRISV
jgi:hypothetical protein